uniref:Ig-like domain-containing protein n=1 Tax=Esox lucius TaxID=8010 RepID=A0AAY5KAS5_ESOLU
KVFLCGSFLPSPDVLAWMKTSSRILTPKNPMARVGERLVLTCSASECAGDVTFTWQSLKHRPLYGRMEKNNTASQQIFDPVGMQHEGKVSCVATCADPKDKAQRSASVEVYAFPKDPIISGSELLTEGQDSDLTCIVPDVYPADRLKVQWLLGDKVLKDDKALNPVIKGEAQTVTSVLKYKPTAQDHGQNVTCRATLDIKNEPETRETVASITVQCKYIMHLGPEPFSLSHQRMYEILPVKRFKWHSKLLHSPRDVHISENIQVNIGESFTLTCQAKGHPEPTVLWRKLEKGGLSVMVGDGETLRVKETSWSHDGDYECMSHNTVGNLTAQVTVNVQGESDGKPVLHLSPSGELKEGDSVTISCQSECGSRGRVSLRQVAGGQGAELQSSLGNASITIQSLTVRDSGRYECEATNPFGSVTSAINVTVRGEFVSHTHTHTHTHRHTNKHTHTHKQTHTHT